METLRRKEFTIRARRSRATLLSGKSFYNAKQRIILSLAEESSSMGTLNEERASQIDYIQKHLENFFSLFHCYLIVRGED